MENLICLHHCTTTVPTRYVRCVYKCMYMYVMYVHVCDVGTDRELHHCLVSVLCCVVSLCCFSVLWYLLFLHVCLHRALRILLCFGVCVYVRGMSGWLITLNPKTTVPGLEKV